MHARYVCPIRVSRKPSSIDVVDALTDLFTLCGPPPYIRSDNSPEFVAEKVGKWITAVGEKTVSIEPGSPWVNGYCESFNDRLRDGLLNGEIIYTLAKAKIIMQEWSVHYNTVRPDSSLKYKPPVPTSTVPVDQRPTIH